MGLITGLLTLPLAPVRGTIWVAEKIQAQAENEAYDESEIQSALVELEAARGTGEFSDEEIEQAENVLFEQLMTIRGLMQPEGLTEPEPLTEQDGLMQQAGLTEQENHGQVQ